MSNLQNIPSMPSDYVYALDIGTRNVLGAILTKKDDKVVIIDSYQMPHPNRSMFDGQIHEIDGVAKIVSIITSELEKRQNFKINDVCIAAAGRALITNEVEIDKEIDPTLEIDKSLLDVMIMEAVQKSQKEIEEKRQSKGYTNRYFCVGYSVIKYFIDNVEIKNPIDHRATNLKIVLMTTFLPQSVIDSLNKVLDKINLNVKSLTLEPIAAISVAIPESFRLLNLALVDVGAGTSDIAFTKQGMIFAYNMVDVAGDEITENIMKEYLLDFKSAENLKLQAIDKTKDNIEYKDIVGFDNVIKREDLISKLEPTIEQITEKIANTILETNGSNVSAVFLIGGGCKFPTFKEKLAQKLNLPENRVAIKNLENYDNIEYYEKFSGEKLLGPESITVIGIGLNTLENEISDFLNVIINDKQIKLFNTKELKVSDALVMQGYQPRQLLPQKGKSLTYILNGNIVKKSGGYGEIAKIYVNSEKADLNTVIKNKDIIVVSPAIKGEDVVLKLSEVIDLDKKVKICNEYVNLFYDIKINGVDYKKNKNYILSDNDNIEYKEIKTLEELLIYKGLDLNENYFIKKQKINNDYELSHSDVILLGNDNAPVDIKLNSDNNQYDLIINGNSKSINSNKKPLVFIDIFDYIDFDLSKPKGQLNLLLNGKRANYTDVIKSGDKIEINWI